MPKDGLDRLRSLSAIYFGGVGALDVPDDVALWGLRLGICQGFDQYANLRPTRMLPGLSSPLSNCKTGDMDWMIVRENTEGRIRRRSTISLQVSGTSWAQSRAEHRDKP